MKKELSLFSIALATVGALTLVCALITGGPLRMPSRVNAMAKELAADRPQLILVGNSLVGAAVEPHRLSELSGLRVHKFYKPGSASALWFLMVKNVVCSLPVRPAGVYIFYREFELTRPTFRTGGAYRKDLETYSQDEEPLVDRLTHRGWGGAISFYFQRHWPLFWCEPFVKRVVTERIKDLAAGLLGMRREALTAAVNRRFHNAELDPALLGETQLKNAAAEDYWGKRPFEKQVAASFLPPLIDTARAYGIPLHFVRMKTRGQAITGRESERAAAYTGALRRYLDERGVELIDFSREPRIEPRHFAVGDHLNVEGRSLFTAILAERIRETR